MSERFAWDIERRADGVGVGGFCLADAEVELRLGERRGCSQALKNGERDGRFIAIRPTLISTISQISKLEES